MVKRLYDRDDVTGIRFTRAEPHLRGSGHRNLLEIVDSVSPGGTVFHVIADTPDDTGDLIEIVVDGAIVVLFELPRLNGRERRTAGPPSDVMIKTLNDVRRANDQRSHRMLDVIAADARRVMVMTNGN